MKKLLLSLTIITFISTLLFAERSWNDRIFEFNVQGSTLVSNNLFGIEDIAKETVVIDFTKIANDMKKRNKDFNETISMDMDVGFKLDIPKGLIFGGTAGAQLYESFTIGRELFYFLGYGNELNQDITIPFTGYGDIFVYTKVDLGWNFKKCKVVISPSVYSALLHVTTEGSKLTTRNTNDGKFAYDLDANLSVYTPVNMDSDLYNEMMEGNFQGLLGAGEGTVQNFWSNAGLDLQANVDYYINNDFSLCCGLKMPIIPSKLSYKSAMTMKSTWETTVMDAAAGNIAEPTFDISSDSVSNRVSYRINRPLKLTVGGDFHPWNNIMNYYGNLGLCFEHPFAQNMEESSFYVDYLLGIHLRVLSVLNLNLSTERTDKVFCQKMSAGLNFRLLEVNIGVASASSDFVCSFKQAGANIFFDVHVGL